jgi:hypothetical protein
MLTPGEGQSSGASVGKRKRDSCKYKQEHFDTYGVSKPVHGMSNFSLFCLPDQMVVIVMSTITVV